MQNSLAEWVSAAVVIPRLTASLAGFYPFNSIGPERGRGHAVGFFVRCGGRSTSVLRGGGVLAIVGFFFRSRGALYGLWTPMGVLA